MECTCNNSYKCVTCLLYQIEQSILPATGITLSTAEVEALITEANDWLNTFRKPMEVQEEPTHV